MPTYTLPMIMADVENGDPGIHPQEQVEWGIRNFERHTPLVVIIRALRKEYPEPTDEAWRQLVSKEIEYTTTNNSLTFTEKIPKLGPTVAEYAVSRAAYLLDKIQEMQDERQLLLRRAEQYAGSEMLHAEFVATRNERFLTRTPETPA